MVFTKQGTQTDIFAIWVLVKRQNSYYILLRSYSP